jgi:8-oxo-dGTP diphosphatase
MVPGMAGQVVVGAAILDGGSRVLVAQRSEPPALAGFWELPGGKVDPGESDRAALVRECQEELGVTIELLDRVDGDVPIGAHGTLRVWAARIVDGELVAVEHTELRWVAADALHDLDWLPADRPLVTHLRALLAGP